MQKIEKRSSAEVVADRLREAIVLGDLRMGSVLSESELGDRLGVSRTPVREAFRQLSQEGLIEITPYRGASVFSLSDNELVQVIDFRELIECKALDMAMRENAEVLTKAMSAVIDRMSEAVKAGDVRSYLAEDAEFHLTIVRSAGNAYLLGANNLIASKMAAIRTVLGGDRDMFSGSWKTHKEIFALIKKHDIEGANARLRKHILDGKALFAP
ncbi:MAG: GntR family transcriptional regulator [Rhizobiaceae bacterium]|nr:GntR family transcriptional regulator [Rhizobiaceae bacterium]